MELLGYSLHDFLLFSSQTWWLLYDEFVTSYWFLAIAVFALPSLVFKVIARHPYKMEVSLFVLHSVLLMSGLLYYLQFYSQINPFAEYFAILCVVQWGISLLFFRCYWQFLCFSENLQTDKLRKSQPVVIKGLLFTVSTISLFVLSQFLVFDHYMPLLPGWHVMISLNVSLGIMRFCFRAPLWWLIPSILLSITELLTLIVMAFSFWWLLLVAQISLLIPTRYFRLDRV